MSMPAMQPPDSPTAPRVDEIEFHSLYAKTTYPVETQDGWELTVTRYQPTPQRFNQPLLGEPLLLLHGFSQNRHAWTSGEFVKNLLFFGMDIHILELRGHGKSSSDHSVWGSGCQRTSTTGGTLTAISSMTFPREWPRSRGRPGATRFFSAATRWAGCSDTATPGCTMTSRV